MLYCPQCEGRGGAVIESPNGEVETFTCALCKGERFVTDEVHAKYRSEHRTISYSSEKDKRKLARELAEENIRKGIGFGIKDRARGFGKKI